jgi:Kdo2-lipid IVA lauroyltransferase/acyltransferase
MKRTGYYMFVAFNYVMTLLPLRVLYLFSDLLFLILYHVVQYRRKVVDTNLRNSFPDKSAEELRKIGRRFYRHLSDVMVETLKPTHMSPKEIASRFNLINKTLIDRLYAEGRDVVALSSHYNNWEWVSAMQMNTPHKILTIYKPLKNKDFDRFMLRLRSKYGLTLTPMNKILRDLVKYRSENIRTLSGFIADQTPPPDENAYWTTFLNQETGFYRGAEKVALKYDMAVIFMNIVKVKRGFYNVEYELITEHPSQESPDFITSRYVEMLEDVIRAKPEYWLWSHRRWKHKRPVK